MCGIVGMIGRADDGAIREMTESLSHRGPDASGLKVLPDDNVSLGHTRLSILDLSTRGSQPMPDSSETLWLTYNGELYNYVKIRRELLQKGYRFRSNTDTEVILYAYREWGPDCLKRFSGMFAFALWDAGSKSLFLARDRLGIKPLYYYHSGDLFAFASEIKALLKSKLVDTGVDYDAIVTPAMYQVSPLTGFKNIRKLTPGTYAIFKNGQLRITPYWSVTPSETRLPLHDAEEELDHLLRASVFEQMISDVPVGALLSGGLDSSLIVALMSRVSTTRLSTFTIKYTHKDKRHEQMPDDAKYARLVARLFDTDHHEIEIEPESVSLLPKMVWHLDEPLADPASINTFLISSAAKEKGISVLLNGMGGDEIFGGYRKHLACILADSFQPYIPKVAQDFLTRTVSFFPASLNNRGLRTIRWAKRFNSFCFLPQAERFFVASLMHPDAFSNLFSAEVLNGHGFWKTHCVTSQKQHLDMQGLSFLTRMCLSDTLCFLPDHNLTYSDKCSMAAGVEGRPPLTDHRIVEFVFRLTPDFRIRGLTQKFLLKKVAKRYLPKEIIYRPKAPFGSPLRSWIKGPLSEMINDYLAPSALARRKIYNSEFVWKKIRNDREGLEDNAHLIWTLLCMELWLSRFFG
jgi:asparagine synthase (glutamine-hydrolysing)